MTPRCQRPPSCAVVDAFKIFDYVRALFALPAIFCLSVIAIPLPVLRYVIAIMTLMMPPHCHYRYAEDHDIRDTLFAIRLPSDMMISRRDMPR